MMTACVAAAQREHLLQGFRNQMGKYGRAEVEQAQRQRRHGLHAPPLIFKHRARKDTRAQWGTAGLEENLSRMSTRAQPMQTPSCSSPSLSTTLSDASQCHVHRQARTQGQPFNTDGCGAGLQQ